MILALALACATGADTGDEPPEILDCELRMDDGSCAYPLAGWSWSVLGNGRLPGQASNFCEAGNRQCPQCIRFHPDGDLVTEWPLYGVGDELQTEVWGAWWGAAGDWSSWSVTVDGDVWTGDEWAMDTGEDVLHLDICGP